MQLLFSPGLCPDWVAGGREASWHCCQAQEPYSSLPLLTSEISQEALHGSQGLFGLQDDAGRASDGFMLPCLLPTAKRVI